MTQKRTQGPVGAAVQGSHPCALPRVWFGSRGSNRPPGRPGDGTAEPGLQEGPGLSVPGQQDPRGRDPSRALPRWRLTLRQCWAVSLALLEPWGAETRVFGHKLLCLLILEAVPQHGCHGLWDLSGCSLSGQGSRSGQGKQAGSLEPRPSVPRGAGCAVGLGRAPLMVGRPASRCSRPPWDGRQSSSSGASPVAQMVKNLPPVQEAWV